MHLDLLKVSLRSTITPTLRLVAKAGKGLYYDCVYSYNDRVSNIYSPRNLVSCPDMTYPKKVIRTLTSLSQWNLTRLSRLALIQCPSDRLFLSTLVFSRNTYLVVPPFVKQTHG